MVNLFDFYLQDKYPGLFSRARGVGTFCAIDCADPDTRTKFTSRMKANGKLIIPTLIYFVFRFVFVMLCSFLQNTVLKQILLIHERKKLKSQNTEKYCYTERNQNRSQSLLMSTEDVQLRLCR